MGYSQSGFESDLRAAVASVVNQNKYEWEYNTVDMKLEEIGVPNWYMRARKLKPLGTVLLYWCPIHYVLPLSLTFAVCGLGLFVAFAYGNSSNITTHVSTLLWLLPLSFAALVVSVLRLSRILLLRVGRPRTLHCRLAIVGGTFDNEGMWADDKKLYILMMLHRDDHIYKVAWNTPIFRDGYMAIAAMRDPGRVTDWADELIRYGCVEQVVLNPLALEMSRPA